MNEKKDYNYHIEYNKNNENKLKVISDFIFDDPEIRNRSNSKNYSIEETLETKNLNINGIDLNALKSIRLSQTFGNEELNSQILLDGMAGIKPSNQKTKPDSLNNINDNEINIIKTLYKENTNNKNINTKKNNNYKEDEIIYIKEYENNESENYRNSQENEKMNYEDFVKYRENNKLLKQQNELFIEILDSNKDNNKYNKNKRNIIISNLNEDLNYFTVDKDIKTEIENNKDIINIQKFKSFKNFKNKDKNFPINKISFRKKKSKKYSINEKIYEFSNRRNNNKKLNKFVNINCNEMNKTNNNSLKMKNFDLNKMMNYLIHCNDKFIKHLNNNKGSKNEYHKNGNSNKKNNKIKNNIKKKGSINIININPNLNIKSNFKRNKSVKSAFKKNNFSSNSSKDYKVIKRTIKKVDSIYNYKHKEKKTIDKDEKSLNNKNIKMRNIPTEYIKYCLNRNLSRKIIDNNNLTIKYIKKDNINIINANNDKINECHKNKLNNVSIKKSNSSYKSFKNKNCKINYINKIYLNKNK